MAKFKIAFSGFAYVEADDEEDAEGKLEDREEAYMEYVIDSVEEVDEFTIRWRRKMETEKKGYWVQGDYYDLGDVCSECDYDSCEINPMIPICPCCGAEMVLEDE